MYPVTHTHRNHFNAFLSSSFFCFHFHIFSLVRSNKKGSHRVKMKYLRVRIVKSHMPYETLHCHMSCNGYGVRSRSSNCHAVNNLFYYLLTIYQCGLYFLKRRKYVNKKKVERRDEKKSHIVLIINRFILDKIMLDFWALNVDKNLYK